ncbi:MAG: flagellar basal body-associated FliL family protein [Rickettsiales bacterium]
MAVKDEDDIEEKENGGEEGEEGGKKGGKKKLIIILALAIMLLGGGGAGLYFSGILGGKGKDKEVAAEDGAKAGEHASKGEGEKGKHGSSAKAGAPTFYELPEFLVNLNTDGKGLSFIKMTVVLELANQKDSEQLSALQPRVVNDFNTYLRELRASDLAGSTGLERLREELLMRVNKSVSPVQVNDILFKEIIVQ